MVHWFLAPKSHGFSSACSSWHSAFSQGQAPLLSLCFIPSDPLCKILCLFLQPGYTFVAIISEGMLPHLPLFSLPDAWGCSCCLHTSVNAVTWNQECSLTHFPDLKTFLHLLWLTCIKPWDSFVDPQLCSNNSLWQIGSIDPFWLIWWWQNHSKINCTLWSQQFDKFML